MDCGDKLLSRPAQTRAMRCARPSREHTVLQDGSLVLGLVLATPQGRWHSEFTLATREALVARRLLSDALGVADASQSVVDTPAMLGMTVLSRVGILFHDRAFSHLHVGNDAGASGSASPPKRYEVPRAHCLGDLFVC